MVDSEERLLDRWEEPVLLVMDYIVQVDREAAQRSSYLARLRISQTIRTGVSQGAYQRSQSVVARADLSPHIWRGAALPLQPRQELVVFGVEMMGQDWVDRLPNPCSITSKLWKLRITRQAQPCKRRIKQARS